MPYSFRSLAARRCVFGNVLLPFVLGFPASPAWSQAPLTLDDALRIAEQRAPAMLASSAAARGAREMAVAAGQLPDPVLRAGVDNLPVNGSDAFSLTRDFMTMRRVGVMQEYVSQAKRDARREREERDARRMEAEGAMSLTEVRMEVATAWNDRLYARRSERLLAGLADELAMQARAIQAQVGSGKATAADVLAAQALAVQTSDRVLAVQRQQQAATARLTRWLGEDARRPAADDTTLPQDADVGALAAHDVHNIAHLRLLASQLALSDADIAVARESRNPNWSWEVAYAQRGPAYSNMISVGVSVPLPIDRKDRQDRELAARLAQRDQARELLEDARRRHQAEFEAIRVDLLALRDRQRALEASLLPLAHQRVEAQLAAYRSGQQGLAGVLDARRAEVDARLSILDLERDAARLWAQLRYTYIETTRKTRAAHGVQP
jgi:outer membrane protein TolC